MKETGKYGTRADMEKLLQQLYKEVSQEGREIILQELKAARLRDPKAA